jgi:predicted heme/steroid binding protein/uncharacterized membrane protein
MKSFDERALSGFNGKDGKALYVAHRGKVYDLTESKLWKGGLHMKRHEAGQDLTTEIQAAPHGPEILERYPQVATFTEEAQPERPMPRALSKLLSRYPILRRHPHPMVVHFPIVFTYATVLFNLLYLLTGVRGFEATAVHCLGGGILFTPVAIVTGWFTWWLNYLSQPMRAVTIKIRFSLLLMTVSIAAFVWRIKVSDILLRLDIDSVIYMLVILSLIPLVTVVGWFGATLTYPIEKE